MKMKLFLNAQRTGYSPSQIKRTMTVGELIAYLKDYDEETPVYLKHDGGYTYGGILERNFEDEEIEFTECEVCGIGFYDDDGEGWSACEKCRRET